MRTRDAPTLRLWGAALSVVLVIAVVPAVAGAHAMPASAVLLDINAHDVGGEIELPVDRLAVALQRTLTPAQAAGPLRARLAAYAQSHIGVTGSDGRAWKVAVAPGTPRWSTENPTSSWP